MLISAWSCGSANRKSPTGIAHGFPPQRRGGDCARDVRARRRQSSPAWSTRLLPGFSDHEAELSLMAVIRGRIVTAMHCRKFSSRQLRRALTLAAGLVKRVDTLSPLEIL